MCRSDKHRRDSKGKAQQDVDTLSQKNTIHDNEGFSEYEDDTKALQELGLPTSFGKNAEDNCNVFNRFENTLTITGESSNIGMVSGGDTQEESTKCWRQGYDPITGHYYYYCEKTQESQWEVPSEGYVPISPRSLTYIQHLHSSPGVANDTINFKEIKDPTVSSLNEEGNHSAEIAQDDLSLLDVESKLRMVRTGMMPYILEPEGIHQHYSTTDEDKQSSSASHHESLGSKDDLNIESHPNQGPSSPKVIKSLIGFRKGDLNGDGDLNLQVNIQASEKRDLHRRRKRRGQKKKRKQMIRGGLPEELQKYWAQRYSLFSLYDNGIEMDAESWYSVTPENIAKHQAQRLACICSCHESQGVRVAIDAFSGAGGNAIQLALAGFFVIAIDINPHRMHLIAHNASVYGVREKIELICGDFLATAPSLVGDVVFYSPPWGGPEYMSLKNNAEYDVEKMGGSPHLGLPKLIQIAFQVIGCKGAAIWLPRHASIQQIKRSSLLLSHQRNMHSTSYIENSLHISCEIERAIIANRVKGITAYYSNAA